MKNIFKSFVLLAAFLLVGANCAWAYTISNGSVTFAAGETLIIDFSGVKQFKELTDKMNASVSVSGTIVTLTFNSGGKTINQNDEMFHWKHSQSNNEWRHNGVEWFKLSASGTSATGSVPCPDKTGYTTLKATDESIGGACTFTWSGGSESETQTYTVSCSTDGGGVTYNSTNYTNNQSFSAPTTLTKDNLTAIAISGYTTSIAISGTTVTVTYTASPTPSTDCINSSHITGKSGAK